VESADQSDIPLSCATQTILAFQNVEETTILCTVDYVIYQQKKSCQMVKFASVTQDISWPPDDGSNESLTSRRLS
jgi:hypothetical protein